MYGLTEAFRATYLPPDEVDRRPESMGKAIPNTEVMVVRPDGTPCDAEEPGELVQRGSLVALGYWNDPAKTAERFKPAPGQPKEQPITEMAVWSGDTVKKDEDGFLYFIGRKDEMIKTSGLPGQPDRGRGDRLCLRPGRRRSRHRRSASQAREGHRRRRLASRGTSPAGGRGRRHGG